MIVKHYSCFLTQGRFDTSGGSGFFCPEFTHRLEEAKFFRDRQQLVSWLDTYTNMPYRSFNRMYARWELVSYLDEAESLKHRVMERLADPSLLPES